MNKKALYLGFITSIFMSFTGYLFYQKSLSLRINASALDLQKELLRYIEKEEVYPENLKDIKFNNRKLDVIYEVLEDGRACRFTIGDRTIELWDEKR